MFLRNLFIFLVFSPAMAQASQVSMPVSLEVVKSASVSFETLSLDSNQLFALLVNQHIPRTHQLAKIELESLAGDQPAHISAHAGDVHILSASPTSARKSDLNLNKVTPDSKKSDTHRFTIFIDGEFSDVLTHHDYTHHRLGARLDVAINY